MRASAAKFLDWACSKTHWTHRIDVPESWFEPEAYATWRGSVCNLLYGCKLADLAFRIDADEDFQGTPWASKRPYTTQNGADDPYGDGMDDWGDPTDWAQREDWSEAAGRPGPGAE